MTIMEFAAISKGKTIADILNLPGDFINTKLPEDMAGLIYSIHPSIMKLVKTGLLPNEAVTQMLIGGIVCAVFLLDEWKTKEGKMDQVDDKT